ncbi:E3 ubiquitin-protein ligase TRIM21-like [Gouania willdenowi]|uniref:E3 ubiquitin-protein ligase TRIM21-like n=1 Tax=Gouania willdenowi TaxID=441366 RepID=A0A8C5HD55_GOUWI|nr:E3 ubiquitin-protein ligase TRIM21-like [Gouania willdenowi]XP_028309326.1 E3 ubiquitin-protein ligase TRIM21-like [Gouania willdenowi]
MGHIFSQRFDGVDQTEVTEDQQCDTPPRMSGRKRKADEDFGNCFMKRNRVSKEDYLCPICMDVFTEPVSTPCGHNFCKSCFTTYLGTGGRCTCPLCNQNFSIQPQMKVNSFIHDVVSQFRRESEQQASSPEVQQMIQEKPEKMKECVDMPAASCGLSRDHLLCHLCHKLLNEPVSTPCGHNFCKSCIITQWDASVQCSCPICNQMFSIQHQMKVNTLIRDVVSQFRRKSKNQAASPKVQQKIQKRRQKMKEMKMKRLRQSAVDVTFDPLTAHHLLRLSDDGKQVYCSDEGKILPDGPERFSSRVCVLGKQSFSSGQFYFEVEVTGKTGWILGVANESITRKGLFPITTEEGYWVVWLSGGTQFKAGTVLPVRFQPKSVHEKVGVFVDYNKGVVSFYDVDTAALIYSFFDCSFTNKLYPFFGPCLRGNDGGKNSAPMIICPVNQHVNQAHAEGGRGGC